MIKNIVVIGATSAICGEASRLWAKRGYNFLLVARNSEKLDAVKKDLESFGAGKVDTLISDLIDCKAHDDLVKKVGDVFERVDIMLVGHGTLVDQEKAKTDYELARLEIESNYVSFVSILTKFYPVFVSQKSGRIGVITSVAGDRGRRSNYVYGSAKAGTAAFVDGLRAELAEHRVKVIHIKPGIVRTPMTSHLNTDGPLAAEASKVGADIVKAVDKGQRVLYTPFVWRLVMTVIKNIPAFIFDKMRI